MVIRTRGVSASIHHDGFISVMVEACEAAHCMSPVPGPLDNVTTWPHLASLNWRLEEMDHMPLQYQVLKVVRDWNRLLLTWLLLDYTSGV